MQTPLRILYIDDNPHDRELVRHALVREASGYELVEAASRGQFESLLGQSDYDVVLSDFNILGFEGLDVIRAVRARNPRIPVVIVTGTGSEEVAAEAIKQGASDYVIKSVDHIHRLPHAIEAAITKKRLRDERERNELRVRALNTTLDAIRSVNQLIIKEKNRDLLLQAACDIVSGSGAAKCVWIVLVDPSGQPEDLFHSGCGRSYPELARLFHGGSLPDCARKALAAKQPLVIRDPCHECDACLQAKESRNSAMVVPMEQDGRLHGLLGVFQPAVFLDEGENRDLLEELAGDIAFALSNLTLQEEHQKAARTLEESEKKLRAITNSAQDAVIMMDDSGLVSYWNPAAERMFGVPRSEMLGRPLHALLAPERYRDDYQHGLAEFRKTGGGGAIGETRELTARRADGSEFPVELSLSSVQLNGAWHAVGLVRDITERKESELMLRNSVRRFQAFMDHFPGPVFIKDSESRYLFFNQYYRETVGADSSWIGKTFGEATGLEQLGRRFRTNEQRVLTQGYQTFESQVPYQDGDIHTLECHQFPIELEGQGRVIAGISLDITDRKQLQEERDAIERQLRSAQKLEAIATLAGGIAHDFNNILAAVIGFSELTLDDVADNPVAKRNLESVLTAARRARDLVQQILTIGRRQEQERQELQLRHLVNEALKLLRSTLPTSIAIQQDLARNLGTIYADPTQMHQVIMNLATNAGHAMRETGGQLEVALRNVECVPDEALGEQSAAPVVGVAETGGRLLPGPYVQLSVKDSGHGMDASVLERIFDPYFTTKKQGEGTGLGLSVVQSIVEEHGGVVMVESEPGRGTEFRIYLPRVGDERPTEDARAEQPLLRGHESILLVDDEEPITRLGQQLLERLGYRVSATNSSLEALEWFEDAPDRFDLVITDMTMPDLTGDALARQLLKIRPDLPIVLCTGFSDLIDQDQALALGIRAFLGKPLDARKLSAALRRIFDSV